MIRPRLAVSNTLVLTFVAVAGATAADAQAIKNQFSVTTRLGAIQPERAASLNTGGFIGLDAEYTLSRFFGVGTSVGVARMNTHKEDFLTTLRFGRADVAGGDSVYYQQVGQPVNLIDISAFAVARAPLGRFTPYATAGVGNYTMILDAQISGQARRSNDLSLSGGGGVWLNFSERAGIQLDARLLRLRNYDRNFIDPTNGRNRDAVFFEDFEVPPAPKNTATSAVFTLGFRYIPGALGGGAQ
jgi:hypothetical protein